MLVSQILRSKADDGVLTIGPDKSVAEAARVLSERRIGSLVVSEDGRRAVGILSERDIVREVGRRGQVVAGRQAVEGFLPGAVGRRLAEVVAAPGEGQRAPPHTLGQRPLGQRGLADARLPADQHQRSAPGQRGGQRVAQGGLLALAAHEGHGGRGQRVARGRDGHGNPAVTVATGAAECSTGPQAGRATRRHALTTGFNLRYASR